MPILTTTEKAKYDGYESDISDLELENTAQQQAINLNTAKETNIAHPVVETAVPSGALFTDTIYDDSTTVKSEPTGNQTSILRTVGITQADYDALTPDANTLYVING